LTEFTKKDEIRAFRNTATEKDFEALKQKVKNGDLTLSVGRDQSRRLLRKIEKAYYYTYFSGGVLLGMLTIALVYVNKTILAAAGFAVTLIVFISFWMAMTRRVFAWAVKEKRNFDYAFYSQVISIRKGEEEIDYPKHHWKDALL